MDESIVFTSNSGERSADNRGCHPPANVASDVSPSWSADGSTFFCSATDGDADLWVERF